MSKLLNAGYSANDVLTITKYITIVKAVSLTNHASTMKALEAAQRLYSKLSERIDSTAGFQLLSEEAGITWGGCHIQGGIYPTNLLVVLPDGKHVRADLLHQGGCGYEYAADGSIVRATKLYGDRDILNYSTNPLQYLKFRTLPTERAQYNLKQDPHGDDDYSGVAPVFLGVELEVERKKDTPKKIEHMVIRDLGQDYAILKSDGSVPNGFEIVTAPATIGFHLQAWEKFFDKDAGSAKLLQSYASGSCGMHVHVSRKSLSPMHLGKVMAFMNNKENFEFITSIAQRNSSYSKFDHDRSIVSQSKFVSQSHEAHEEMRKLLQASPIDAKAIAQLEKKINTIRGSVQNNRTGSISNLINDIAHAGDRYSAVNLRKEGTIEFRIYRGNVSKIGMLKNIEFTQAVIDFCREATFRTGVLDAAEIERRKLKRTENTSFALHHTYFLDWLAKDNTGHFNNLKLWLQTHKITDKFAKRQTGRNAPPKHISRATEEDIRACA